MLIESDRAYLDSRGYTYELELEGGMVCLVIKDYALPPGYSPGVVDLLLRLPSGFPSVAPDMFWIRPLVRYSNGAAPPATELRETYLARIWQRWSRHLAVAWRPGTDNLQTYLRLIRTDLERSGQQVAA
jgi:hypothetical protein